MTSALRANAGLHVAIIMDGNGRWATRRGLPRTAGHRAGVEALRRVVEGAPALGVGTLTLFAFSSANWQRPAEEVDVLMRLMQAYLRRDTSRFVESGARLSVIGRRDRLRPRLRREIESAEEATTGGRRLHVRIALDYSSREAIARAAARCAAEHAPPLDRFGQLVAQSIADDPSAADVDLLLRTGGERRLSDFLLWECAFAELWFTDRMWPEFGAEDLRAAVAEFHRRERRFGGLGGIAPDAVIPGLAAG
jgi:undecaprenyl diphosphate synthase